MVMLEEALERILTWHKQHGRKVADLLQPGLTAAAIADRTTPFALAGDAAQLYLWRNGTRLSQEHVLNDHYFTPGYYLLSLEDALEAYGNLTDYTEWQKGWLPVLASGGGDYYGVDAKEGRVIHHLRDSPHYRIKYLSLTNMMESVAECYESGAYYLDDGGFFEVNTEEERRIAGKWNAGVAYWGGE
jgi:cell wall assembly regulator SMI1